MEDKGKTSAPGSGSTRQAQRLVKAAVKLCEPYAGPGGAVVAGMVREGKVTSGMWGDQALDGNTLSLLAGSLVHAINTCLAQGGFQFRFKLKTVKLEGDTSSVLDY